jgi:hypothetical protein
MKIAAPFSNLGDNLWITPALKYCDYPIQMIDEERCRKISKIYNNLTSVQFVETLNYDPLNNKEIHNTKQIFFQIGLDFKNKNLIPKIKLEESEIKWARIFLEKYENPIVIINDNSGSSDPSNKRASFVLPPREIIQQITSYLSKKFSVLQFGLAENFYRTGYSNFSPLENAYHIRGLEVRQLAACYHVIGKYIGGDTGDYHLMLAVGGRSTALVPEESYKMGYIYNNLFYSKDMWNGEDIRVSYINYLDLESIKKTIKEL